MHEQRILDLLVELNEKTADYNSNAPELGSGRSLLPKPLQLQIAGEIAKFLRQGIVLLPPESNAEYCSKCGKKLREV